MSLAAAMRPRIAERSVKDSRIQWPAPSWRGRHLELARDLLGYRTLERLQRQIIEAYYAHERAKIAACTGQKRGKTEVEVICILVDFATEPSLNYFLFAPKIDHTNEVLWPRLAKVALAAYFPCADCIPAHRSWCALVDADPLDETPRPERCANCSPLIPSEWKNPKDHSEGRVSEWLNPIKSEGGLRAPDGRTVRGYAARKLGAKGGLSGVVRVGSDESNDIDDETEDSWDGNLMGGGKRLSFGNLLNGFTRWFGKAFAANKNEYTATFRESSRLSQNCRGRIKWSDGAITEDGRWILFSGGSTKRPVGCLDNPHEPNARPIKGIADVIGIEAYLNGGMRAKNLVAARVDAEAPAIIEGQLITLGTVHDAEQRWAPTNDGLLQLGVDVARMRDKLAIAVRRGNTIVELYGEVLGQPDHARGVEIVIEFGKRHRKPHERKPRLVFDGSGLEGENFAKELRAQKADDHFDIYRIEMGAPPSKRFIYYKIRDELAHNFGKWLKHGAIPTDIELEAEIEATTSKASSFTWNGVARDLEHVVLNDDLRKADSLGRSPDLRNACELAVHNVEPNEAGSETPANDVPQAQPEAATPAPTKRHAEPANDTTRAAQPEEPSRASNIFERQSMIFERQWGRR